MKLKKNKKIKILCFDLDNTICTTKGRLYKNSKPIKKVIRIINKLYDEGNIIKIYTARFMGRNLDKVDKIKKNQKNMTIRQLETWNVKYHKIFFGKPSFDILIDDKSFNFDKKWFEKINLL